MMMISLNQFIVQEVLNNGSMFSEAAMYDTIYLDLSNYVSKTRNPVIGEELTLTLCGDVRSVVLGTFHAIRTGTDIGRKDVYEEARQRYLLMPNMFLYGYSETSNGVGTVWAAKISKDTWRL